MPHPYKYILLLITLVLPYLIVAHRNRFDSSFATALRFALAVAAVWGWLLCTRLIVDHMDARIALTPEQLASIHAGDGARNASALLFGWVPGVLLASISWCVARSWHWLRAII
ncbi:hypothetical protein [Thauera linaloolentis]|uniref:Transmembrane protein n=1 Tax=Thauera linaloolentis (strain DSM 12138 / JCM 21573 / CCUG 41526 / CIP 105981 / IAM 15112 / NBRC 102519 / 47Lol) TaxID=1123367 RepID=N6XZR3_THAL4|nr:hypothetical protein [Thauera linaloolentis]ENO84755.1 hypothetical protein C666_16690 [Thauera linaloolentis 47Lol = DSM 12138]MCM8567715.1 hypothetical protein [Thauera linaloolentis]